MINVRKIEMGENTPKHKIEDMTLGQIKGLKEEIADELKTYLKGLSEVIAQKFDVGAIGFSVDTNIRRLKTDGGEEWGSPDVSYNIDIHFSKED